MTRDSGAGGSASMRPRLIAVDDFSGGKSMTAVFQLQ